MKAQFSPGFYGKVLTLGDFVQRRLPPEFLDIWEDWLQGALLASREQLGEAWLDIYLNSPIWRFGLSPGICGKNAWAGVLLASTDKVGRLFPLILAAPLAEAEALPHLFAGQEGHNWFEALEHLAESCLRDGFDLDDFDLKLQSLKPPGFMPMDIDLAHRVSGRGKFALHVAMPDIELASNAFLDLGGAMMRHFMPTYSLWSCSLRRGASLMLLEGMPPIDAYAGLLTGCRKPCGWEIETLPVRLAQVAQASMLQDGGKHGVVSAAGWRSWGVSVVGMKRAINEDSLLERDDDGLWAVADGMGGHHAGDVASQAIVSALAEVEPCADALQFAERVKQSLCEVNRSLIRLADESGVQGRVIGSTAVVLLAVDRRCVFLWAGDSRLYLFREGRLRQLTRDHSLFQELLDKGLMTPEQLSASSRCETITRAVGGMEELALEQCECEAVPGDLFLLCSDGIEKELSDEDIQAVFLETPPPLLAEVLIKKAEERGARDNVTAVVVQFNRHGASAASSGSQAPAWEPDACARRFPHPDPLPEGEGDSRYSLRDFHGNA